MEAGTFVRSNVLVLAIVNQLLASYGDNSALPITDEEMDQQVATLILTASAIWAWWKNNSLTKAAEIGDAVMKEEKYKSEGIIGISELVSRNKKDSEKEMQTKHEKEIQELRKDLEEMKNEILRREENERLEKEKELHEKQHQEIQELQKTVERLEKQVEAFSGKQN
ncbi:phage holin [Alkalicoccus halolimnae]|uniref:Phage holin n=1 Tax=Alkalicoccus halolimnae TaxID=1667239 RepID=A0AAJ8LVL5_9BACI|nr:phage holin [Alkalicoccus halolimnae]